MAQIDQPTVCPPEIQAEFGLDGGCGREEDSRIANYANTKCTATCSAIGECGLLHAAIARRDVGDVPPGDTVARVDQAEQLFDIVSGGQAA